MHGLVIFNSYSIEILISGLAGSELCRLATLGLYLFSAQFGIILKGRLTAIGMLFPNAHFCHKADIIHLTCNIDLN